MRINKLFIIAISLVCAIGAWAQSTTLSPYSRYGYGLLNDNASAAQRAMGGVGYAMSSGRQANVMNPASYASIDSLTFLFDIGADLKFIRANENSVFERNVTGGLDYVTMAFPVWKRIGVSIGLLPYATTGYSFTSEIDNGGVTRDGTGGISLLYGGIGIMPFNNFSVGANFAYMFGSTTNDVYATASNGSLSVFERYMRIRDWKMDIGVQYTLPLNHNNKVTVGVTYSPGKSFHGETYGVYYDSSNSTAADTTGYTKLNGLYSMPETWGAGINYTWQNRLILEADFTYQPWKNVKYTPIENFETSEFTNRWKMAGGIQFTPKIRGSYLERIQYRAGAYYNHDYLVIRGNNVVEYGATVGLGLPVPMFKTIINVGFEYKHRQAHPNPLVKENYFNLTLGVNFNELWFRKNKIY